MTMITMIYMITMITMITMIMMTTKLMMFTWGTGNILANCREGGNTTPGKSNHGEGNHI